MIRTLLSNLALCVHPELEYVRARDPASGRVYVVAEARLPYLPGAIPKAKKGKKGDTEHPAKAFEVFAHCCCPFFLMSSAVSLSSEECTLMQVRALAGISRKSDLQCLKPSPLHPSFIPYDASLSLQVIGKLRGAQMAGQHYRPLFPYFAALRDKEHMNGTTANGADAALGKEAAIGAFRVVADGYVTADSGTGVVHCAPAFGEEDMRVCLANGAPLQSKASVLASGGYHDILQSLHPVLLPRK